MPPPYDAPIIPTRGSPGASSCASGRVATQSSIAWTSRPSKLGSSISTDPPDSPNPRGSQVKTLNPSLWSAVMGTDPSTATPVVFVSPGRPQPGPINTVGAG